MTELAPDSENALELARHLKGARAFAAASISDNTRRAYEGAWRYFSEWCAGKGASSLPASPATLCAYLDHQAREGNSPATVDLHLAAISKAHRIARLPSPRGDEELRAVRSGFRKVAGVAPGSQQKRPLLAELVAELVAAIAGERLADVRDRAILTLGFSGAFRRSELVGLEVRDVVDDAKGLRIRLRRSKTDVDGEGETVGIPFGASSSTSSSTTCPVRLLQAWLSAAELASGPLFRPISQRGAVSLERLSPASIYVIVRRRCELAGLRVDDFGAHSLRSGLATSAAAAGVEERVIQRQTRHKSLVQLRKYIREGDLFLKNAAEGLL